MTLLSAVVVACSAGFVAGGGADALNLTGNDAPEEGWEIVPSYDAKCLVAYLMSLDQSHELKEAKGTAATAPASSPAPATSPAPAKEEKK